MATQNTFLKYTGLTYAEILKQITDRLRGMPEFDNFRESAIAQTVNEIFAGVVDMTNYYVERQAEESFWETSQRESSAYLNSRNLAYDITRPIPASTTISITIKGNMVNKIMAGRKLQLPVFTKFTYQNNDYFLKKGFTYTFTETDQLAAEDDLDAFEMVISTDDNGDAITLIQGTLKSKTIAGSTNPQVGQIFQTYRIPDVTFSNYYGDADLPDYPVTRVWVGDSQSDDNEYIINRKSLINDDTIQGIITNTEVKCCLIRTAIDGDIELKFGNDRIAYMGSDIHTGYPTTTFDNIYIQYLSTQGTKANLIGIIGERLDYSNQITITTYNITESITFKFLSNITGGGDIETADSIKMNAPAIFYSLDRAVNGQDHVNILKTLTSPMIMKNAIAWGEQEEAKTRNVTAIVELFNVGFFCCIGSLYNIEGDSTTATYSVRTKNNRMDEAVLDDSFDEDGMSSQYFFNIYTKNNVAQQLKEQVIQTPFWKISNYVQIDGDIGAVYFKQTYQNDVTIYYNYKSETYLPSIEGKDVGGEPITGSETAIVINIAGIDDNYGMSQIATIIQDQLRTKIDRRSEYIGSVQQNSNYGELQFPNISVTWNGLDKKYTITNATTDPCYLDYIDPFYTSANQELVQELGLHDASGITDKAYAVKMYINTNYNFISDEITQVINTLSKKGQITIKYIYASPVIQGFRLAGIIYVEQLFSLDDLHREVNNAIYQFLDTNADFNVDVHLSNIINVIEEFPGIAHADVYLQPDIPYPTTTSNTSYRTTFFFPILNMYETINAYSDADQQIIIDCTIRMLQSYFYRNTAEAIYIYNEETWREFIDWSRTLNPDQIYENIYYVNNYLDTRPYSLATLTERNYLVLMTNELYKLLNDTTFGFGPSDTLVTKFQDTPTFMNLISDIHKDLTWIIRSNMIDSNGNIAPEYTTTQNSFGVDTKTLKRGGYSLGCEIIKVNLEATSSSTATPYYLNYQYK